MDNIPLSYDSLKVVLSNLDANKRFEISARCPSIQKTERLVPLKIDYLNFRSSYMVQVNNTSYNLGIIRKYREGNTPVCFKEENLDGGINEDLDQWGFKHKLYANTRTPGDIDISFVRPENIDNWMSNGSSDSKRRFIEEQLQRLSQCHRRREGNFERACRQEEIESYETQLLPYLCRDNNMPPPYNSYIQLSSVNMEGCRRKYRPLEVVLYRKRIYEAMKYLLNFMFGGRIHHIHVKHFEAAPYQIIRLSKGIKFNVRDMRTRIRDYPAIITKLLPILNESCLPIKHIHVIGSDSPLLPLTADTEGVTFHGYIGQEGPISMDTIIEIPMAKVNFPCPWVITDGSKSYVGLSTFIKKIMKRDKAVGTKYTFRFEDEITMKEIIGTIEKKLRRHCTQNPDNGFLIIRMTDTKCINISYKCDNKIIHFKSRPLPWVFVIEVMEKKN